MRCLQCHLDGIPADATVCPKCGIYLPSLLRDTLPMGTLLQRGQYHLDYPLGQGGFGITYRAMEVKLERPVAIKELFPKEYALRGEALHVSVAAEYRAIYQKTLVRFVKEGQVLARLNHPGIVRVLTLFEEHGTAYMVMEIVSGCSLRAELDKIPARRLPEDRVRGIMDQIVDSLASVHAQGILHLDIKPDNVMLTHDSRICLIDFGAARQSLMGSSSPSTRVFTLEYAPVELLSGDPLGPGSDIFELGMLLHELLTGTLPPPALSRLHKGIVKWVPELPEPWQTLIAQAINLSLEARPSDIREWWAGAQTTPSSPLGEEKEKEEAEKHRLEREKQDAEKRRMERRRREAEERRLAKRQREAEERRKAVAKRKTLTWAILTIILLLKAGNLIWQHFDVMAPDLLTLAITAMKEAVTPMPFDLARVVAATPAGGTVTIPAGDYVLDNPLIIKKSLTLLGVGKEKVTIRSTAERCVIGLEGNYTWHLEGVTIKHFGRAWAFPLLVDGGRLTMSNCVCTGGVWEKDRNFGGCGLSAFGTATVHIEDCVFTRNRSNGIQVRDTVSATLERNRCEKNGGNGIGCYDESRGDINNNICRYNKFDGIRIAENAYHWLNDNKCEHNRWNGITFRDAAKGKAEGNDCRANLYHGIVVAGETNPLLLLNRCNYNRYSGICNVDTSHPTVTDNSCGNNKESGIVFFDDAAGTAKGNHCFENGYTGISVLENSSPTLVANYCLQNKKGGIAYAGNSTGIAERNICQQNTHYGISLANSAAPLLRGNTATNNKCGRCGNLRDTRVK